MATTQNSVTFSSNGTNYRATHQDIFMDNGALVVYIEMGKHSDPTSKRVPIKQAEWERIKPQLNPVDYEAYYGRKPLMSGVNIYQVK